MDQRRADCNIIIQRYHFNLPFEKQIEKIRYNVAVTTLFRLMAIYMSPGKNYLEMSKGFTELFQTDMLYN